MSDTLFAEWAPKYAARGIHVFPCLPKGKEPLTKHGFLDASIDPEQIEKWSKQYPNANIGIYPGPSNLLVLDVGPRNGGIESMKALADEDCDWIFALPACARPSPPSEAPPSFFLNVDPLAGPFLPLRTPSSDPLPSPTLRTPFGAVGRQKRRNRAQSSTTQLASRLH